MGYCVGGCVDVGVGVSVCGFAGDLFVCVKISCVGGSLVVV